MSNGERGILLAFVFGMVVGIPIVLIFNPPELVSVVIGWATTMLGLFIFYR